MIGTTRLAVTGALSLTIAVAFAGRADAQTAGNVSVATSQSITIGLAASGAGAPAGGEAVLRADGVNTVVEIELKEAPADAEMAGFLVQGKCADTGEVIARLGSVEVASTGDGTLTAEVPIDLATLASADVAVEVRPADQPESSALACGEHTVADGAPVAPGAGSAPAPADLPAPPPMPNP
jgi:hypothetical protein